MAALPNSFFYFKEAEQMTILLCIHDFASLQKRSTQFLIQFGNLNFSKHFFMKLWSRISNALVKSEKNIKLFFVQIINKINDFMQGSNIFTNISAFNKTCFIWANNIVGNFFFLAHLSTKCSVSFCDPSMSGVRRPSVRPCVRPCVNNFFKQHLL